MASHIRKIHLSELGSAKIVEDGSCDLNYEEHVSMEGDRKRSKEHCRSEKQEFQQQLLGGLGYHWNMQKIKKDVQVGFKKCLI